MGYDNERTALYQQYQDASAKITLLSALDLAQSCRAIWPDAAYVVLETTDQGGDYQHVREVLDAEGEQLGEGEDFEVDGNNDEMETAGNLHTDSFASELWLAHCIPLAGTQPCEWFINNATTPAWCCNSHMYDGTGDHPANGGGHPEQCPFAENDVPEQVALMARPRQGYYVLVIDSALTIDPASFAV
jgi:hypothetical protein